MRKYWEKIKLWGKENWPVGILLLLSAVAYRQWLSFAVFFNEDYGFTFSETGRDFLRYSAWDGQTGFGLPSLVLWMWSWKILPAFFAFFGFDSNVWDKIVLFWPFVFLTPVLAYFLVKEIVQNKFGAFIGACVYSWNTYYLAINTQGHLSLSLAGTFAAPAVLFFWRYFRRGGRKNLVAAALFFALVGGYDFRVAYQLFFLFLFFPFWFLFLERSGERWAFFQKHFWPLALFFVLLLSFNLFWIMPTAVTGSLATNEVVGRELVANNYFLDLKRTITLFHPFWNGGEPEWFDDQDVPAWFWLVPVAVLLGAFLNRKKGKLVGWFLIALVGVFLAKQDAVPLEGAYVWLHRHFPGFNAFREASKFYFLVLASYAVLIGALVAAVFERFKKNRARWLVFGVLFGLFFTNLFGLFRGEMKNIFTPRQIAPDELLLRDYFLRESGSFRTLWVPKEGKAVFFRAFNPKLDAAETRKLYALDLADFSRFQGEEPGTSDKHRWFFSQEFATRLLSRGTVAYLVVKEEERGLLGDLLSNPAWEKIELDLKEHSLYRNRSVRPRVYLTEKPETFHRDRAFQTVPFSAWSGSRWEVELEKSDRTVWLNFSERYHPAWRLVCSETKWYQTFFAAKLFSVEDHFQTDAGLNAFRLDPEELEKRCVVSKEGMVRLSLFYLPQAWLNLGGLIFLLTTLFSLGYLFFGTRTGIMGRGKKGKKEIQ